MSDTEFITCADGHRFAIQYEVRAHLTVSEDLEAGDWCWDAWSPRQEYGRINQIHGRCETVDEAWTCAKQAARLLGALPDALVECSIDAPVVRIDGEVIS